MADTIFQKNEHRLRESEGGCSPRRCIPDRYQNMNSTTLEGDTPHETMAHECKGVTRSVIKRHELWQGRLGCPIEPVSDFHLPFTPVFTNEMYRQVLYTKSNGRKQRWRTTSDYLSFRYINSLSKLLHYSLSY
jgi:hypothetical protein